MNDAEFERNISEVDGGCWDWQRPSTRKYASVRWNGRSRSPHSVAWERVNGPIPDGHLVAHDCNNVKCCNPSHLRLMTRPQLRRKAALEKLKDGFKTCVRCQKDLPLSEFRKYNKDKPFLTSKCVPCIREYDKELFDKHNGYYERRRETHLRWNFGIGVEDYNEMLAAQEGVCKVCGLNPEGRKLSVDHDHDTGKVRGILCQFCNCALGYANDDPSRLEQLAQYLRETQ